MNMMTDALRRRGPNMASGAVATMFRCIRRRDITPPGQASGYTASVGLHSSIGSGAVRPIRFVNHGGLLIPSLGCIVTVGHAVAGPIDVECDEQRGIITKVTYAFLPLQDALRKEFPFVYIAKPFFDGGADVALMFRQNPVDIDVTVHDVIREMAREAAAPPMERHEVSIHDAADSAGDCGYGIVTRGGNVVVNDIGYPGLSGSSAWIRDAMGMWRLLGMYTAGLTPSSGRTRLNKVRKVVAYCLPLRSDAPVPLVVPASLMNQLAYFVDWYSSYVLSRFHSAATWLQNGVAYIRDRVFRSELELIISELVEIKNSIDDMKNSMEKGQGALAKRQMGLVQRMTALEKSQKEGFADLGELINDLMHRRASVMPLPQGLLGIQFDRWDAESTRIKRRADPNGLKVHGFDVDTDNNSASSHCLATFSLSHAWSETKLQRGWCRRGQMKSASVESHC